MIVQEADPFSFPRSVLAGGEPGPVPELTDALAREHGLVRLAHPFQVPTRAFSTPEEVIDAVRNHLESWTNEVEHCMGLEPAGAVTILVVPVNHTQPLSDDVAYLARTWFRPLTMPQLWDGDQA